MNFFILSNNIINMLGLTEKEIKILVIESFIAGFFWFFFTLYVRRGWNSGGSGIQLKNIMEYRLTGKSTNNTWYYDSLYGGIAAGMMFFFRFLIMRWIKNNY